LAQDHAQFVGGHILTGKLRNNEIAGAAVQDRVATGVLEYRCGGNYASGGIANGFGLAPASFNAFCGGSPQTAINLACRDAAR